MKERAANQVVAVIILEMEYAREFYAHASNANGVVLDVGGAVLNIFSAALVTGGIEHVGTISNNFLSDRFHTALLASGHVICGVLYTSEFRGA